MTSRVLVVDDDPRIRRTLEINLRARGYDVDLAGSGEQALQLAARHHPDAVILDLGLPSMDGLDVVRGLRGWSPVPIVVLSGRGSEAAKVEALDLGADDYLTKPFGMDELFARLRAAVRRSVLPEGQAVVTTPDFTIDFTAKQVTRDGTVVRLTPTQWHIIEVLVRNARKLVTYEQVLREVWGPNYGKETNYLRVFMTQIRQKLEPDPPHPRYFITEPGIGFRFEPALAEPTPGMADIVLVRWPEERAEAARLVGDGVPVLYLIAAGSDLPTITTCTEDWVRVPGDDWELSARMLALQQRAAAHRMPPSIDDDGRLRYNGKVVRLDAGTVPLARLFVERMGDVVTDEELAGGPPATPAALRSQVRSLRSALRDAGLHLERSRSRGYALQPR